MDTKISETQGPPPSYTEIEAQTNEAASASTAFNGSGTQRHTTPPMFITARTSVYGPAPVELDCPHCQVHIVTHIARVAGVLPWLVFGACVVLGFFLFLIPWCFCCIPFFTDQCLDVLHSCPSCKRHLGRYSRI
ncbi:unnamed protein product [Auanema sp. JU1783]|nr:unnamed protein product [Auanema sp. JU1783]